MIIAFLGDNTHSKEEAAKEFIDGFLKLHGNVAIDKFAGEDITLSDLSDALSSIPFLSARRLVVVRDLGQNKDLAGNIEKIFEKVADSTDFVMIESTVDGRSKFFNQLKKLVEVREFSHLEGEALINWVIDQANNLGGTLDSSNAQLLIERVGINHQLLAQELRKLILYNPVISGYSIKQMTAYSPQSSVFAMLDAAFAGDIAKALLLYAEQRSLGMEPQLIMGMIAWQLHIVNIIKAAKDITANQIASEAKLSPYVVRKNLTNAKRLSGLKVLSLLEKAIATDKLLKRTTVKGDDAMQAFISSF